MNDYASKCGDKMSDVLLHYNDVELEEWEKRNNKKIDENDSSDSESEEECDEDEDDISLITSKQHQYNLTKKLIFMKVA